MKLKKDCEKCLWMEMCEKSLSINKEVILNNYKAWNFKNLTGSSELLKLKQYHKN